MKKIISTDKAPKAIGPYSQAVEIDNMLFISGQLPIDPVSNEIVKGGIAEQTDQVLKNLSTILSAAGFGFVDVVKTTCMLSDLKNFTGMNDVYAQYFTKDLPARATFQAAALPRNAMIEMEIIAVKQKA